jgi:hypothetical protein
MNPSNISCTLRRFMEPTVKEQFLQMLISMKCSDNELQQTQYPEDGSSMLL